MAPIAAAAAAAREETEELLRAHSTIVHDIHEFAFSMCLKCVVELGIPDIISSHGGPITLSDLVSQLSIPRSNAPYILRIMRVLVHRGYFVHDKKSDAYSLTPLSAMLAQDSPNSLAIFVLGLLDSNMTVPWHSLSTFCRIEQQEGSTVFELEYGKSVWDLGREHPEFTQLFNGAMDSDSRSTMKAMLAACGDIFQGVRTLVDVGGGDGTTLNAIAEAFPHIKYCTVYDQPHVVANVPKGSLVQAVGGDMFDHIPQADAVLLKGVLHDWADGDCVKILKLCKEAIPSRGKVVIMDIVMDADHNLRQETEAQLFYDITMTVLAGGKEREEHEWNKLFKDAGFTDYKITPLDRSLSLIMYHARTLEIVVTASNKVRGS